MGIPMQNNHHLFMSIGAWIMADASKGAGLADEQPGSNFSRTTSAVG